MKLRNALLGGVAVLVLPQGLAARTVEGPYLGVQGGYTWAKDIEASLSTVRNDIELKDGYTLLVEGGYRLGNGLRAGVEIGRSESTIGDIAGGLPGRAGGAGDVSAWTFMGVLYYEVPEMGAFRPYVGIGAGMASVGLNDAGELFAPGLIVDEDDRAVAWQLAAGVAYALTPTLDLTLGYRFLDTGTVKIRAAGAGVGSAPTDFDYQSHTALVGLRWTFGAAPAPTPAPEPAPAPVVPPAPPPPPPAITRNFTVFFDWDRSDLTADAQQVLRSVAGDARTGNISAVQVTGHADTSGPADYNQRLSMRRAEAVRDFLVAQGIPAGQIVIEGRGETDPLVPTADGVREPSNRRSVIIFP